MLYFKVRKIKQKDASGLPMKGYLQYFMEKNLPQRHKGHEESMTAYFSALCS